MGTLIIVAIITIGILVYIGSRNPSTVTREGVTYYRKDGLGKGYYEDREGNILYFPKNMKPHSD
jgi:hypothetical protein